MAILLANALSTLTLTGLIWFVQVVHYPLFAEVGRANFQAYEREHRRRTGWVVGAPILIELVTSAALVVRPPPGVPGALTWIGLALAVAITVSTALVQGPLHARLEQAWSDPLTAGSCARTGSAPRRGAPVRCSCSAWWRPRSGREPGPTPGAETPAGIGGPELSPRGVQSARTRARRNRGRG